MSAAPGKAPRDWRSVSEDFFARARDALERAKIQSGNVLEPVVEFIATTPHAVGEVASLVGQELGRRIAAASKEGEGRLLAAASHLSDAAMTAVALTANLEASSKAAIAAAQETVRAETAKATSALVEAVSGSVREAHDRGRKIGIATATLAAVAFVSSFGAVCFAAGMAWRGADNKAAALQSVSSDLQSLAASSERAKAAADALEAFRGLDPDVALSLVQAARGLTPQQANELVQVVRQNREIRASGQASEERVPFPCTLAGPTGLVRHGSAPAHSCLVVLPRNMTVAGTLLVRALPDLPTPVRPPLPPGVLDPSQAARR